jgi:hypothetical protein
MSQYQLIPYNPIEDHFLDQIGIPVSAGSIVNFSKDAFERLEFFESWVKEQLAASALIHSDETCINIGGTTGNKALLRQMPCASCFRENPRHLWMSKNIVPNSYHLTKHDRLNRMGSINDKPSPLP